jgi:hypothetical protein
VIGVNGVISGGAGASAWIATLSDSLRGCSSLRSAYLFCSVRRAWAERVFLAGGSELEDIL